MSTCAAMSYYMCCLVLLIDRPYNWANCPAWFWSNMQNTALTCLHLEFSRSLTICISGEETKHDVFSGTETPSWKCHFPLPSELVVVVKAFAFKAVTDSEVKEEYCSTQVSLFLKKNPKTCVLPAAAPLPFTLPPSGWNSLIYYSPEKDLTSPEKFAKCNCLRKKWGQSWHRKC